MKISNVGLPLNLELSRNATCNLIITDINAEINFASIVPSAYLHNPRCRSEKEVIEVEVLSLTQLSVNFTPTLFDKFKVNDCMWELFFTFDNGNVDLVTHGRVTLVGSL